MKNNKQLTPAQIKDLSIEWAIYSKSQQEPILQEFRDTCNEKCSHDDFLEFLRTKLQMDGYWKKIGIV